MITPHIHSWVKQPVNLPGCRILSRDVWTLVPVAMQARQRQIVESSRPVLLARDDVVNVKRQRINRGLPGDNIRINVHSVARLGEQVPRSRMGAVRRGPSQSNPGSSSVNSPIQSGPPRPASAPGRRFRRPDTASMWPLPGTAHPPATV